MYPILCRAIIIVVQCLVFIICMTQLAFVQAGQGRAGRAGRHRYVYPQRVAEEYLRLASDDSVSAVLDVGAGTGLLAEHLAGRWRPCFGMRSTRNGSHGKGLPAQAADCRRRLYIDMRARMRKRRAYRHASSDCAFGEARVETDKRNTSMLVRFRRRGPSHVSKSAWPSHVSKSAWQGG